MKKELKMAKKYKLKKDKAQFGSENLRKAVNQPVELLPYNTNGFEPEKLPFSQTPSDLVPGDKSNPINTFFSYFNPAAQLTTYIANSITDQKNYKEALKKYYESLQPISYENVDERGLQDVPIYTKYGGSSLGKAEYKYGVGGYSINLPGMRDGGEVSSEKAKKILKDGTINGKKLTDAQKRYFGWRAGGGKQMGGMTMPDVEIERNEVYMTPEGVLLKATNNSPMHENGGVVVDNAERVLENTSKMRDDVNSRMLKLSKEEATALTGVRFKRPVSHAEASETAAKYYGKRYEKINKALANNVKTLDKNQLNKYALNSLTLNMAHLNELPTSGEVFDRLFEHQELIKQVSGIENAQAKYGGRYSAKYKTKPLKAQTGFTNYYDATAKKQYKAPEGLTPEQFYTPEVLSYLSGLDTLPGYDRDLGVYKDYTWGQRHQQAYEHFGSDYFNNKSPYIDVSKFMTEGIVPPISDSVPSNQATDFSGEGTISGGGTRKFNLQNQPKNEFNEPLNWYDTAVPIAALLSASGRIPVKLNTAQFSTVRLPQPDPRPALQQGEADYRAALRTVPQTGAGISATSDLFSKKYNIDRQILAEYEALGKKIKTEEILYNAEARNKQSLSDQAAREVFEQKFLGSLEAQRQQKLQALDDLFTRISENKKLNREGNLLMKLFPAFDQYGRYTGYKYQFRPPSGIPTWMLPEQPKTK